MCNTTILRYVIPNFHWQSLPISLHLSSSCLILSHILRICQGQKFINRFDPVTYVKITEQMDSHDVGHERGTWSDRLFSIIGRDCQGKLGIIYLRMVMLHVI